MLKQVTRLFSIALLTFCCFTLSGQEPPSGAGQDDRDARLVRRMKQEMQNGLKVWFGWTIGPYEDLVIDIVSPWGHGATETFEGGEHKVNQEVIIVSDPADPLALETVLVDLKSGQVAFPRLKKGKGLLISQKTRNVWVLGFMPFSVGETVYPVIDNIGIKAERSFEASSVGAPLKQKTPLAVLKIEGKWIRVREAEREGWIHLNGLTLTRP